MRPILLAYDERAYQDAACKPLGPLGCTYQCVQPTLEKPSLDLLQYDMGPGTWKYYRVWACARMTGSWPFPVVGGGEFLCEVDECPYCGHASATIVHVLVSCIGTEVLRAELRTTTTMPPIKVEALFMRELFRTGAPAEYRARHVAFVGKALLPAMLHSAEVTIAARVAEEHAQLVSAADVDALIRGAQQAALQTDVES